MSSSIMLLKSNRRFQVSLDIALLWWSWKTKHTWYTLWNKQNMLWWVETRCILMLVIMYNEIQSCSWGNSLMFPERSASSSGLVFCCHVLSKYFNVIGLQQLLISKKRSDWSNFVPTGLVRVSAELQYIDSYSTAMIFRAMISTQALEKETWRKVRLNRIQALPLILWRMVNFIVDLVHVQLTIHPRGLVALRIEYCTSNLQGHRFTSCSSLFCSGFCFNHSSL